jgi:hypothetical protein
MRSRDVQKLLVAMTGRVPGDIDTRTRVLRKISEGIASGPRGPAAPHMSSAEWAAHVGALVGNGVPEVGAVFGNLTRCVWRTSPQTVKLFEGGKGNVSILALIAYVIEHGLDWVGNVEIDETGRFAWVTVGRRGGGEKVFFSVDPDSDDEFTDARLIGNRFVIGAAALRVLHTAYAEDQAARQAKVAEVA